MCRCCRQVEAHVPPTLPNNTVRKTKPRIVPKLIPKPERPTEAMLPPLPEMLEKPVRPCLFEDPAVCVDAAQQS